MRGPRAPRMEVEPGARTASPPRPRRLRTHNGAGAARVSPARPPGRGAPADTPPAAPSHPLPFPASPPSASPAAGPVPGLRDLPGARPRGTRPHLGREPQRGRRHWTLWAERGLRGREARIPDREDAPGARLAAAQRGRALRRRLHREPALRSPAMRAPERTREAKMTATRRTRKSRPDPWRCPATPLSRELIGCARRHSARCPLGNVVFRGRWWTLVSQSLTLGSNGLAAALADGPVCPGAFCVRLAPAFDPRSWFK